MGLRVGNDGRTLPVEPVAVDPILPPSLFLPAKPAGAPPKQVPGRYFTSFSGTGLLTMCHPCAS